jgi:GxxExxY protein
VAAEFLHGELTYKLIGLGMEVHRQLGAGFLERVYENSLMILLRKNGIRAEQQVPIKVRFQGEVVCDYCADIIVERKVIPELKASDRDHRYTQGSSS